MQTKLLAYALLAGCMFYSSLGFSGSILGVTDTLIGIADSLLLIYYALIVFTDWIIGIACLLFGFCY